MSCLGSKKKENKKRKALEQRGASSCSFFVGKRCGRVAGQQREKKNDKNRPLWPSTSTSSLFSLVFISSSSPPPRRFPQLLDQRGILLLFVSSTIVFLIFGFSVLFVSSLFRKLLDAQKKKKKKSLSLSLVLSLSLSLNLSLSLSRSLSPAAGRHKKPCKELK